MLLTVFANPDLRMHPSADSKLLHEDNMTDDLMVTVNLPKVRHAAYVSATLRVTEDWTTKRIEVNAYLGIAPDEHTIIEYPVHVWNFGYWNRAKTRKVMSEVKKRFLAECDAVGYTKKDFTLETSAFWER